MAKFVKVKIAPGINGIKYPAGYDPVKIRGLAYNDTNTYLVGVVKDADLAGFLKSGEIVEITQAEAEAFGNIYRPQIKKIYDSNKIINILEKLNSTIQASPALTQTEKDALDPDKSEVGINRSKTYTDIIAEEITRANNG